MSWRNWSKGCLMGLLYILIMQDCYRCSYPDCSGSYTRKYRLREHEQKVHGVANVPDCTKNFSCPFGSICGEKQFRTNVELITHCDKIHREMLGIYCTHSYSCVHDSSFNSLLHGFRIEKSLFCITEWISELEGERRRGYIFYICENSTNLSPQL